MHFAEVADFMLTLEHTTSDLVPMCRSDSPWLFGLRLLVFEGLDRRNLLPDGLKLLRILGRTTMVIMLANHKFLVVFVSALS